MEHSAPRTSADSQPTKLRGAFFWLSTLFKGEVGSTSLEGGKRVSWWLIMTVISFWIRGVAAKNKEVWMKYIEMNFGVTEVPTCLLLTFHHSDGVFYLRFEQVDPHHRGQVLHIHLVHPWFQLHLKQKPEKQNSASNASRDPLGETPMLLFAPPSTHRQI